MEGIWIIDERAERRRRITRIVLAWCTLAMAIFAVIVNYYYMQTRSGLDEVMYGHIAYGFAPPYCAQNVIKLIFCILPYVLLVPFVYQKEGRSREIIGALVILSIAIIYMNSILDQMHVTIVVLGQIMIFILMIVAAVCVFVNRGRGVVKGLVIIFFASTTFLLGMYTLYLSYTGCLLYTVADSMFYIVFISCFDEPRFVRVIPMKNANPQYEKKSDNEEDRLNKLRYLYESGVIDGDEYLEKRKSIIESI